MAGKFLIGAAAAALYAFGATGVARAADVSPVVIPPIVTPVVVAAAGPKIEISTEQWFEANIEVGDNVEYSTYHDFSVKVTSARGFGFQLLGNVEIEIPFDEIDAELTAAGFITRGAVTAAAYTTLYLDEDGFDGFGVGGDFTLDNDRLTLHSYVEARFGANATFSVLEIGGDATVHLGERLDLYTGIDMGIETGGFFPQDVWAGAQFHLGPFSPYATLEYDFFDFGVYLGAEFEHQLGNSPLSLLGYAELHLDQGDIPEVNLGLGIKFSRGGDE